MAECCTANNNSLCQIGTFFKIKYLSFQFFRFFFKMNTAILKLRGDAKVCHDLGDPAIPLKTVPVQSRKENFGLSR